MQRRKFLTSIASMAGLLAVSPLVGCGSSMKALASSPTPAPTPSPAVFMSPTEAEADIRQMLDEAAEKFGLVPFQVAGETIFSTYGRGGGLSAGSTAALVRQGVMPPPKGFLDGEELPFPEGVSGFRVRTAGYGWGYAGIKWTKEAEFTGDATPYVARVKKLFEEAAEALSRS